MDHLYPYPKMGSGWLEILHDPLTRRLIGYSDQESVGPQNFVSAVQMRLSEITKDPTKHLPILKIGYSALEAFLQSNCTGPRLDFDTAEVAIPPSLRSEAVEVKSLLLRSLEVDGNAVYPLTPHAELFWLAHVCMSNTSIAETGFNGRRARLRVTFVHARLLQEKSETLREKLYSDAAILQTQLSARLTFHGAAAEEHYVEFLMERAAIRTYYGDDDQAREDLLEATKIRHFQFALTGVLGKRTKFQDRDISQLVVLAKSRDHEPEPYSSRKPSTVDGNDSRKSSQAAHISAPRIPSISELVHSPPAKLFEKPENILLNDDTLLEQIQFQQVPSTDSDLSRPALKKELPHQLASLDLSNQPLLFPMDSIILLTLASTISTTSPSDSLIREETLPYATRVLEGGSSNWQVYTQALLVRSRIEGYKSRTAERGLLQLQALVDQVIAETTSTSDQHKSNGTDHHDQQQQHLQATSFLPKATAAESATVAERLRFIYQLSPPLRWELESELAARWVSMGGLKTALEIYERLQLFAEVALCLAATDQEPQAVKVIRRLLFEDDGASDREVSTLPPDAPRLFCILGDITKELAFYERAWTVSGERYARAQRSLGQYYSQQKKFEKAAKAYRKALAINRLNASTWFALGCIELELEDWESAVNSFTRCVRESNDDAQAWSNLAVALLKLPEEDLTLAESPADDIEPTAPALERMSILDSLAAEEDDDDSDVGEEPVPHDDDNVEPLSGSPEPFPESPPPISDSRPYRTTQAALAALKHAARLKPADARIWDNYLTVSARIPPPSTPWRDVILAQKRVIELRGKTDGESCIDENILAALVRHVTTTYAYPNSSPGSTTIPSSSTPAQPQLITSYRWPNSIPFQTCALLDTSVQPLITSNARLHRILSDLDLWRGRPHAALTALERAWRIVTTAPGAYDSSEGRFDEVVDETVGLVKAYEELGARAREGLASSVNGGGEDGDEMKVGAGVGAAGGVVMVEKNWRFKARSAVRGVMGKVREAGWEGTKGWERLVQALEGLKAKE